MSQTVNEKKISPRTVAPVRDEKQTKIQLQYTPFGAESQALISILGQDHVIEMLFQKWINGMSYDNDVNTENIIQAIKRFGRALSKVKDEKITLEIEECDVAYATAMEKNGFYCGARYMLNLIFGGELLEN